MNYFYASREEATEEGPAVAESSGPPGCDGDLVPASHPVRRNANHHLPHDSINANFAAPLIGRAKRCGGRLDCKNSEGETHPFS